MEFNAWLIYLGVISAIIFLPGPSALLCMSHGLQHGRIKAIATVVGGAVAAMILMSISIIGLGAVLEASETIFLIIKLIGASYLIYLGVSAWKSSFAKSNFLKAENDIDYSKHSFFSLFQKGFLVGISNPKDLLFFAALLPSFIDNDLSPLAQYATLAGTWFVVDVSAMYLYASLGCKVSPWFAKPRNIKLFERTTGSIFIATGSALIASSK